MYDIYFANLLKELNDRMHSLERENLDRASTEHDEKRISIVKYLWQEEELVQNAEDSIKFNNPITGEGLSTIVQEILENRNNYHENARVDVNNHAIDFDQVAQMASHYVGMSLKVYAKGTIFDARDAETWKSLGLKTGDSIEIYGQDLETHEGDPQRSYNAVHENLARLIGKEHPQDNDIEHYVKRELIVDDSAGIHARPSTALVKGAGLYEGNVHIRNPLNGTTANAKSILEVLTHSDRHQLSQPDLQLDSQGGRIRLEVMYEPGYDTSASFSKIKDLLKGAQE
ncbi:MAG: HPr family phosphocarrier protein [Candidatus Woesearchaeota archaeon]